MPIHKIGGGNVEHSYRTWMDQFNMYNATILSAFIVLLFLVLQRFGRQKKLKLPPGPPGIPFIGHLHLLGKLPHRSLARLSKKYGPVMSLRLGSLYTVVISSPESAKEVLKTQDSNFASRPPTITAEVVLQNSDMIWAPLGERWQMLRKICVVELLNSRAIQQYKQIRVDSGIKLVRGIVEESGGRNVVRLDQKLLELMNSSITQLLFKKHDHTESKLSSNWDNAAGKLIHLVEEIMCIGPFTTGDFLPILRKLDLDGKEARLRSVGAKFEHLFQGIIEERRREGPTSLPGSYQDFVDVLLSIQKDTADKEHGISDKNIRAILLDLITAGSDSTAHTMGWVVAELMRNPDIRRKAQSELDRVVGKERLVNESDLPQLAYLRAVIKESLRLHPVAPLMVTHMAVSDCEVEGYDIPSNSQVFVNSYAIMRDPSVWENPLEFLPDRFLTTYANIDTNGQSFQFLPFGSGRRRCPGSNLALLLLEITVATLLHACDFSLPDGMNPEDVRMDELFGHTVVRANPLEVIVNPRNPWLMYSNIQLLSGNFSTGKPVEK